MALRIAPPLLLAAALLGCEGSSRALVCSETGGLDDREATRFAARARLLERELGLRFGLRAGHWPDLGAERSAHSFETLGVAPDGRGALLMIDREAGRSRLELGYALEAWIPDSLAGQWLDSHLHPLTSHGDEATPAWHLVRMLHDRARHATLDGALPRVALPEGSGGAGATGSDAASAGSLAAAPNPASAAPTTAPAQSPEAAYERYLAWLTDATATASPALFTQASVQLIERWAPGPAYREHVLWREAGRELAFVEGGTRAMAYARDDPFLPPHFFVRDTESWKIDLAYEAEHVIGIAGGPYAWSLHPALARDGAAFANELVWIDGVLRVARGDNRKLSPKASAGAAHARASGAALCEGLRS